MAQVFVKYLSFFLATKMAKSENLTKSGSKWTVFFHKKNNLSFVSQQNEFNFLFAKWTFRRKELLRKNVELFEKLKARLFICGIDQTYGVE